MATNWQFITPRLKAQGITATSTTQLHALGEIQQAADATLGAGEFIYLKGVASVAVGTPVIYSTANYLTSLAPVGSNKPQPIAVAMAATTANLYGWFQISGNAVGAKTSGLALASNAAVGILTAGKFAASGSGKEIQGALTLAKATVPTSVSLILNRPHYQGRIT
jgi:hypothetical protein